MKITPHGAHSRRSLSRSSFSCVSEMLLVLERESPDGEWVDEWSSIVVVVAELASLVQSCMCIWVGSGLMLKSGLFEPALAIDIRRSW